MSRAKKFVSEKGYYEILEVSPHATTVEIQRSFERLCDEYVDIKSEDIEVRKKSAEVLYTLTKAYEILTDPFQRLSYDERRFGNKLPFNNEVETIFKEGLRYFRTNNMDNAIRFYKEAVYLMPNKVHYRVNLAIAYHEKGWREYAEKELRMALRLDPQNEYAQEVVARILFSVSDKKSVGFFSSKVNRQLAAIAAVSIVTCGILVTGIPKAMAAFDKVKSGETHKVEMQKANELNKSLPSDMQKAIEKQNKNSSAVKAKTVKISKLDNNFAPSGQVYDYTKLKATKKTYYPDQRLIVVDYSNGSMLTYKPEDLQGWKYDMNSKQEVVITTSNEIIPVPVEIPVSLPNGDTISTDSSEFPADIFPEYGVTSGNNKAVIAKNNGNINKVEVNTVSHEAAPAVTNNSPVGNASPAGLPPVGSLPGA